MLGMPFHRISLELKDFFRLTSPKLNLIHFMLSKYFKITEHA
jgi:hypothetical protein